MKNRGAMEVLVWVMEAKVNMEPITKQVSVVVKAFMAISRLIITAKVKQPTMQEKLQWPSILQCTSLTPQLEILVAVVVEINQTGEQIHLLLATLEIKLFLKSQASMETELQLPIGDRMVHLKIKMKLLLNGVKK